MRPPTIDGAPGLRWRPRADHYVASWQARTDIARRGYPTKSVRLWPPSSNTKAPLTDDVIAFLRAECTRLQDAMLAWANGEDPTAWDGTLTGLVRLYQTDPDSPYRALRFGSKRSYDKHTALIERTVGGSHVAAIKGRDLKRWFERWSAPAAEGEPRRVPRAHAAITLLRILFGYGASILEDKDCARLKAILSELSFERGRPRREEITRAQALIIIREAHAAGRPSIALAQALAFDLALRQKDVIGEWIPVNEPGMSDVLAYGQKWTLGLDWREVSPDLVLTHRLSKSLHGRNAITDPRAGKTLKFDLRLYPLVMAELAHVPADRRMGPMVIDELTGRPYYQRTFGELWRAIADCAGIPRAVQFRDSRAGAITEGLEVSGGDIEAARIAAGHSNIATTQIYSRGEQRRTAHIARLRARKDEPR